MPKWSTDPRPLRPSTPEAWASSTIMMAPYFSASAASLSTGPMSPSIEKTPSVITSLWPGLSCELLQQFLAVRRILVAKDFDRGS